MTNTPKILLAALAATALTAAHARDDTLYLSINDALNSPKAAEVLDPSIKITFAGGSGGIIKKGLVSNKKTNAVGKSDEEACQWALLSALKQFQETAKKNHAARVINLVSYYKRNTFKSHKEYECHAGGVMAGVTLKGDIAK
ncbi:MAG: excinuclease ATPase subunit [Neisseria sp.]|nr:excinuclease ATPase subunit [Neisseria sp.]